MKEIQDIIRAFDEAQKTNKLTALATVVHVEGSSYRRPGARMLITEDGELTGAISGGCLEGDALRKARQVIVRQKAKLVTYDTTDEEDTTLGVGLGCNGIIHILIEPILAENPINPIQLLKKYLAFRQRVVLITLFVLHDLNAEQPGTCYYQNEAGSVEGQLPNLEMEELLLPKVRVAFSNNRSGISKITTKNQDFTAFIELLQPPVKLVIVGAGNDVMPLVQLTAILGWESIVVDGRAAYASNTRFPLTKQIIVAKPDQVLQQLEVDSRTIFLLMTHNYNYDIAMLRQLVYLDIPYIGVLGPKKKLDRMLDELFAAGIKLNKEQKNKIFGPTGLCIGAETAEEIALAVTAEIKAVLSGEQVKFLRDLEVPIHERENNLIFENTDLKLSN